MSTLHRVGHRLRDTHPFALDTVAAVLLLVLVITGTFAHPHGGRAVAPPVGRPGTLSVVLMVIGCAALVLRRRAPIPVLVVTSGTALVEVVTGDPRSPAVAVPLVIALFTVACATDRPTAWLVGLPTMAAVTGTAMLGGPYPWYGQENIGLLAWMGLAVATGDAVRSRRAYVHAIRERAERAERTREEEARRRVAEERLRIARDLHDVVAHHIALVNVQAGVAAHVMDKRPDQAKEALAHVREASRSALDELRATVGLLRQSGDPTAPTEPAPGLARLDELAGTFRSAGLPVRVVRADEDTPLPASVDLAAYRVIQEALTNVRKHAGPGAEAEVSVVRAGRNVEITVIDDGAGGNTGTSTGTSTGISTSTGTGNGTGNGSDEGRSPSERGGGHGLLGMRERATALGGSLDVGPRYGGGFRVHAILPVEAR